MTAVEKVNKMVRSPDDFQALLRLVEVIKDGQLNHYQVPGCTAHVVQYEGGKQEIIYNLAAAISGEALGSDDIVSLIARHSRPGVQFEIVASARWEDCSGNPRWTIHDDDGEAVAAIAYYYPV